jgi:uncharacterized membrane protein
MLKQAKLVIVAAVTALILDAIWLTLKAAYHTKFFEKVQGSELKIRLAPAALIYILIPAAVVFFTYKSKTLKEAILKGAFLGLAMYGVYDLTNYATLTHWTLEMTLTDIAWGTFLCATVAAAVNLAS